jgi:hypothetical protein
VPLGKGIELLKEVAPHVGSQVVITGADDLLGTQRSVVADVAEHSMLVRGGQRIAV